MQSFKKVFVCGLALVALSCDQDPSNFRKNRVSEADVLSRECDNLKITNGRDSTDSRLNGVVNLSVLGSGGKSFCTGTFIRPDTILTAAHCFEGINASRVDVKLAGRTIRAASHKVNSLYTSFQKTDISKINNDLALIYLSTAQKVNTIPVCNFTPPVSTDAIIVGYGYTSNLENTGSGKKKEGFIKIAEIAQDGPVSSYGQAETTTGDGSNASTAQGDSGGPLLVEDENKELCIFATTQSGQVVGKVDFAIYTNLRYRC